MRSTVLNERSEQHRFTCTSKLKVTFCFTIWQKCVTPIAPCRMVWSTLLHDSRIIILLNDIKDVIRKKKRNQTYLGMDWVRMIWTWVACPRMSICLSSRCLHSNSSDICAACLHHKNSNTGPKTTKNSSRHSRYLPKHGRANSAPRTFYIYAGSIFRLTIAYPRAPSFPPTPLLWVVGWEVRVYSKWHKSTLNASSRVR